MIHAERVRANDNSHLLKATPKAQAFRNFTNACALDSSLLIVSPWLLQLILLSLSAASSVAAVIVKAKTTFVVLASFDSTERFSLQTASVFISF